ncbi:ribonuclease HII [Salegentibacter sp. JZCK2]|uniref:ribonuclease HII n=1 Tax=Salegentibacter tibetensis TaxID=2873600 RepID=UPI001CCE2900|nr:ribonuclease HII [Salegentibacter tibetensis]MBZ9731413.1 ribonuclease HII [Salegentibacter tibetensis]
MLKMFNLTCPVAGTDEAGRGCLAGPVTAAAVILPKNFKNNFLNDSKQTKLSDRKKLKEIIIREAISYGVAHVYMEEIDEINILNASILAMHRAIEQLGCEPEHIIVDGNKFKPYRNIVHDCIIKGDGKFLSIAAASILAKTARDEFMEKIHQEFPIYNWKQNKGYPTKEHRHAIMEFGSTPYHRKSFKLLPEQLKLPI